MGKRKILLACIVIGAMCGSVGIFGMASAESNLGYDVRITPSLLVTIPSDTVSLNLDPFTSAFGTANLPITVSTNNPTGFTLNMSASETDLTLVNGSETIPTLADKTGGYSEAEFTANRWGYKLSTATNYSPFALSNQLLVTDSPSNASVSTVNFASKVDATKPAGTYELTINFTAVANYVPPTTIDYCAQNSIADANCMQKMVASNCTTTAKTVMDSRDGEQYLVQELADGNCWLLDNLRLDPTDPQVQVNLSVDTTNASNQTLNYLKGVTTRDPNTDGNYATAGVSYWTSSNSFSAPLIAIKDASDTSGTGWNPNTTTTSYGSGSGKIGVYYNFCAASAGSYCYDENAAPEDANASQDICPAGWRMPTGGGSGEYQALYTVYSNATSFRYALSTPLSGRFFNSSASYQGALGLFWSSTRIDGSSMYYLFVSSSNVDRQDGDSRDGGSPVRCLLQ